MAGPPEGGLPSPEELQEAIFGLLRRVSPSTVSEELVARALQQAAAQESRLGEIYESLLHPPIIAAAPRWGLNIANKSKGIEPRLFHAPKRFEECDEQEVIIWLASFGTLLAPMLRATLMTHGFTFTWQQAKGGPSGPAKSNLIVLPGGKKG